MGCLRLQDLVGKPPAAAGSCAGVSQAGLGLPVRHAVCHVCPTFRLLLLRLQSHGVLEGASGSAARPRAGCPGKAGLGSPCPAVSSAGVQQDRHALVRCWCDLEPVLLAKLGVHTITAQLLL